MSEFANAPPTAEHLSIQHDEEILLNAFAILSCDSLSPSDPEKLKARDIIANAQCKLEDVFDSSGESHIRVENESFEEKRIPHVLAQQRPQITEELIESPATVSKSEFSSRFAECCHHLLDGTLNWIPLFGSLYFNPSNLTCIHFYPHSLANF
jgi:hypothetical protein